MDTASTQFVLFGLVVAALINLNAARAWRSVISFLASLGFLYLLEPNPISFLPLAGFLVAGYVGMILLSRRHKKLLPWTIAVVLFVYVWLKQYAILPDRVLLHSGYFTIGLSYILFRVLHLLVESAEANDVWRPSVGEYLLYVLNFTTLLCGPIQDYRDFARCQFSKVPLPLSPAIVARQLERIVLVS